MPSEAPVLPTQTEKPHHYMYLKEFRTQQCPLFLQHKCTQHRPFTCFHWHFMNQRRRRPIRKRDGTFNYSPDMYCTKYDETTGICPDGDECPYLHRTAGDTERRYHLRYYKTGTCVHETDSKGHCVKNGPHCAFAHGAHDLRPPAYDVRELQTLEGSSIGSEIAKSPGSTSGLSSLGESPVAANQLEKDRIINEDPKWNDTNYVLANYKTEQCKRPPRLCRQGYACPSYHNSRDRRRSPRKFKYRSTPCPNVKHGDDWGDPTQCDSGDNCPYCHTRTEQQFHPEIYKSTKCNDMVQTGYCPRGPFCAFAHVEQEMTTQRDIAAGSDNSLAAFVTNVLPPSTSESTHHSNSSSLVTGTTTLTNTSLLESSNKNGDAKQANTQNYGTIGGNQNNHANRSIVTTSTPSQLPEPIGKGRSSSTSSPLQDPMNYQKAPGSEREDTQSKLRQQIIAIESDPSLDQAEKNKRTQNLLLLHSLNVGTLTNSSGNSSIGSTPTTPSSTVSSAMSPHAPSFYPAGDTVESVIGNALDEDLNLGELSMSSIDKEFSKDNDDTNSVCSSLSTGFPATSYLGATSVPVTIPSGGIQRGSLGSISPSSSPVSSLPPAFIPQHIQQQQKQEQQLEQAAAAFLSQPNPGKYSAPGFSSDFNSMSPRSSVSQSPLLGSTFTTNSSNGYGGELQRLREELATNKAKLLQWEEGISQARSACEAWKREAEESSRKAKIAEEERIQAYKQRDEAILQVAKMNKEIVHGGSYLSNLNKIKDLESLPVNHLRQIQSQLRKDLETLEKTIFQNTAIKCLACQEKNKSVVVMPCNHYALCDACANKRTECPFCHTPITHVQRPNIVPL